MDVKKEATRIHESGHNCAQSVFCSCREYTGIDDKTALAISGGFVTEINGVTGNFTRSDQNGEQTKPQRNIRKVCVLSYKLCLTVRI